MELFDIEALTDRIKNVGRRTASALREVLDSIESSADPDTSARGKLLSLFDKGTFSEIGTFVSRNNDDNSFEGVICGWGAIDGSLVFAFSQDTSKCSRAVSSAHAAKICELYRLAVENGAPVIGIFDSAGALIPEGTAALAGYGKIMKAVSSASGVIPQIAIASGYVSGALSVICGMYDFVISTDGGSVSVNAPVVTEGAGDKENMKKYGVTAISAADDLEAIEKAKELLAYLPSNNAEGAPSGLSTDEPGRASSLDAYRTSNDGRDLIRAVADNGRMIELYADYAKEIITSIVSVGGVSCGIIAPNKAVNGGKITADGARKASRMISLIDSFNIPVITLVDSVGIDSAENSEFSPFVSELAKLAGAYAACTSPMITVVVGEAYGTVFTVLGSKSIGADVVYALDSARIAALNAKSAVAFLMNDSITGEVSREDLEKGWEDTVCAPAEAASIGQVDDIISDEELRARICSAIYMLSSKCEGKTSRRHLIMPL